MHPINPSATIGAATAPIHAAEVTMLIAKRPIAAVLAALATSGVFVLIDFLLSQAAR
jgi:hypothetical protein